MQFGKGDRENIAGQARKRNSLEPGAGKFDDDCWRSRKSSPCTPSSWMATMATCKKFSGSTTRSSGGQPARQFNPDKEKT
jgi:hypothetical protein